MVRLNTDGTTDNTFNSGTAANNIVYTLKVQSDDKILIGGHFTTYNSVTVPARMACLNADGSRDATFNSGGAGATSSFVLDIALNSSQDVFIGGAFVAYNGTTRNKLAKLQRACTNASITSVSASTYTNCGAVSTTLTVTGTLNDATAFQWYNTGCGTGSIGSGATIVVSPTATTTFYVRGEGGCTTPPTCSTVTINVNTVPTVSISVPSNTFCIGTSITMTASGASTYVWTPGNSTATSVSVAPASATTYTLVGTAAVTGCTNSATQLITPINCVTLTKLVTAECNSTLSTMDGNTRLHCDAVTRLYKL